MKHNINTKRNRFNIKKDLNLKTRKIGESKCYDFMKVNHCWANVIINFFYEVFFLIFNYGHIFACRQFHIFVLYFVENLELIRIWIINHRCLVYFFFFNVN